MLVLVTYLNSFLLVWWENYLFDEKTKEEHSISFEIYSPSFSINLIISHWFIPRRWWAQSFASFYVWTCIFAIQTKLIHSISTIKFTTLGSPKLIGHVSDSNSKCRRYDKNKFALEMLIVYQACLWSNPLTEWQTYSKLAQTSLRTSKKLV